MAILEHELGSLREPKATGLSLRPFSIEEYEAMGQMGFFDGQQVELIEGGIVYMAPMGPVLATVTYPLSVLLMSAFGPNFIVRNQVPIIIKGELQSEPQPDIAVVAGSWRDYLTQHPLPSDVKLIVEIADSSLGGDRKAKAALYASAGIPEYWIVNLIDNNLEVYREPANGIYTSSIILNAHDLVAPLFATDSVTVGDFLP